MINAKEKAADLVTKMWHSTKTIQPNEAKACALVAVDEIINIQVVKDGYWLEVKNEIIKL